ncbi:MAG: hypothetical protein G8345_17490 [Magnetococcales bacterium]|nr:hypothetical protein [Magnetococcales bacterium]NGZ28673.1 hypothetical protein [Magnetococcales bacterium]
MKFEADKIDVNYLVTHHQMRGNILHTIESELLLPADGKLPAEFQAAFGRRVRVIVMVPENSEERKTGSDDSRKLMEFAGTINWPLEDAVAWQQKQRGR